MDAEEKQLMIERAELAQTIERAQQRLSDIDEYIRLRAKIFGRAPHSILKTQRSHTSGVGKTKRDRILDACDAMLANGQQLSSRELLKGLKSQGIEVGGADEAITVSSYLSREKDRYIADRKNGWKLIGSKKANPGNAPTSPGLFS